MIVWLGDLGSVASEADAESETDAAVQTERKSERQCARDTRSKAAQAAMKMSSDSAPNKLSGEPK